MSFYLNLKTVFSRLLLVNCRCTTILLFLSSTKPVPNVHGVGLFLFVFSDMCKLDLQRARKSELQRHKRMKARDANSSFLREYGPTITVRNEVYFLLVAAKAKQVADVKKEFVKAEKQAARESKEASQKRRVEELTALRVFRAKTEEYTLFVRKLVQEITQGTVKSKHMAGISGMCRPSLDELVWKVKTGNVYRGCQGGRPEFMSKPEIREVLRGCRDARDAGLQRCSGEAQGD